MGQTLSGAFERVVGGFLIECQSRSIRVLWEKVARKVGEQSLLYSCYSTSAWIEEVMVRRLRLGPASLCVRLALIAMLSWQGKAILGVVILCAITILYEMVFIDPS